eukprot:2288056-Prymnesium_polylepis.2
MACCPPCFDCDLRRKVRAYDLLEEAHAGGKGLPTTTLANSPLYAPSIVAKLLTEFIGTFFLVLTYSCSRAQEAALEPLAVGLVLAAMVFMGGHISGAHYNPAVSLAVALRGGLPWCDMLAYMGVQLVGSTAAGGMSMWVFGQNTVPCPTDLTTGRAQAATGEVLFSFALCLVVLNVATTTTQDDNSFFGVAIGATVFAGAVSVGSVSGGSFNPAVGTGLYIATGIAGGGWSPVCAYLALAPFVGAMLAALVFLITLPFVLHNNSDGPKLGAKLLTEFIGTFFLVFTISCSRAQGAALEPLAVGLVLAAMVFMGGHISGANYNPAVSLAVALRGKLPWDFQLTCSDMLAYMGVQVAGATAAGLISAWIFGKDAEEVGLSLFTAPPPHAVAAPGVPCLADQTANGWAKAAACEVLFSFALCLVVLNVATTASQAGNS